WHWVRGHSGHPETSGTRWQNRGIDELADRPAVRGLMRQIVLDTETTGLETARATASSRSAARMPLDRRLTGRHFHQYINLGRPVDEVAVEVHGITSDSSPTSPRSRRSSTSSGISSAASSLVIHNAPFDLGFDNEPALLGPGYGRIADHCTHTDSLSSRGPAIRDRRKQSRRAVQALLRRQFAARPARRAARRRDPRRRLPAHDRRGDSARAGWRQRARRRVSPGRSRSFACPRRESDCAC
ncbi:MAG: hypothetical protein IPO20_10165, partial [Gammaproteobacteria bacterium]|nr:hypothetical protein [Gammaproteobacteria bacterium]